MAKASEPLGMSAMHSNPVGPARTDDEIFKAIADLYKAFPEASLIFNKAVKFLYQMADRPLSELDVPVRALKTRAAECKGYATLAAAEITALINSRPRSPQENELVAIIERAVQRRLAGLANIVESAERDRNIPPTPKAIVAPVAKATEPPRRLSKAERAVIGAEMAATIARAVPPARSSNLLERILATIDARDAMYAKANAVAFSAANGIDQMELEDEALCQADRELDAAVRALQEEIPSPASGIADVVAHAACVAALLGDDVYADPEVVQLTWAALELGGIQGLPQFARFK